MEATAPPAVSTIDDGSELSLISAREQASRIVAEAEEQAAAIVRQAQSQLRSAWGVRIQGYLVKHKGMSWQRRFCVLRGNLLLYYPNHAVVPDMEPKGVLDLQDCTLLAGAERTGARPAGVGDKLRALLNNEVICTPFAFAVTRPNGVRWRFCAESDVVARTWIHAILDTGCVAFEDADPRVCEACGRTNRGSISSCLGCALPLPAPTPRSLPPRPSAASLATSAMHNGMPVAGSLAAPVSGLAAPVHRQLGGRTPADVATRRGNASVPSSMVERDRADTVSRRPSDASAASTSWGYSSLVRTGPSGGGGEGKAPATAPVQPSAPPPAPVLAASPAPAPAADGEAQEGQVPTCEKCSSKLRPTAKFCHVCGTQQQQQQQQPQERPGDGTQEE